MIDAEITILHPPITSPADPRALGSSAHVPTVGDLLPGYEPISLVRPRGAQRTPRHFGKFARNQGDACKSSNPTSVRPRFQHRPQSSETHR
jgi:hypothetical protein